MSEQTPQDRSERSAFASPWFIGSALVVAVILVMGAVLGVQALVRATSGEPQASPTALPESSTAAPSVEPSASTDASVCDAPEGSDATTLATAPDAEWAYQGTVAYPASTEYGPFETADEGYRYCYQHSIEGALFAAANTVSQGSDSEVRGAWLEYVIAEGPYREEVLGTEATDNAGVRMTVAGFRVLEYTEETARVDIAVTGTANGETVTVSAILELVWENGDWRMVVSDPEGSFDYAGIPNLVGYVIWGP